MLLLGLFFICEIFCATAIEIKLSKSKTSGKGINIAVDTMLQFDNEDNSEDIKFINKIHKFIGKIKNVIEKKKIIRHQFSNDFEKNITFMDFIQKLVETLTQFDNEDLKYFVTILSDEITKYHYRGCKFYELTENDKFRRFFAHQLDKINSMTAAELRNNLKAIVAKIEEEKYNKREKEFIELINSVYSPSLVARFENILIKINDYKKSKKANLTKIVRTGLRMTMFDHYTRLNRNARLTLKSKIADLFNSSQFTPQLNKIAITASKTSKTSNIGKRSSSHNQNHKHHKHVVVRKHLKADKPKSFLTFLPKALTTNKITKISKTKEKNSYNILEQKPNNSKHKIESESQIEGITFTEYDTSDIDNKGPKILQQPYGWSMSPDIGNDNVNSDNVVFENQEIVQTGISYSPNISLLKPKYDFNKFKRHYKNIKSFKPAPNRTVPPKAFQTFIIVLTPKTEDINKHKSLKSKIANHKKLYVTVKPPELYPKPFDGMNNKEFEDQETEPTETNYETKTEVANKKVQTFKKNVVDSTLNNYNNLYDNENSNSEAFKQTNVFDHNYFQTTTERNIKHFMRIKKYTTANKNKGNKLTFKTLYPEFVPQWSGLNTLQIKKGHIQIPDRTRAFKQRETSTNLPALRINKITNNIISSATSSLNFSYKPRNIYKQRFDSIETKDHDDDEMKAIRQLIAREQLTMFRNNPTTATVIKSRYKKISTVTENISEERQLLNDNNRRSHYTNLNNVRQFPVYNNTKDVETEINNDSDNLKGWKSGGLDSTDEEHSIQDNNKFIRGKPKSKLVIRKTNTKTKKEFISKYEYKTQNRQVNNKYSPKKLVKESPKSVSETQDHDVIKNNTDINYLSREEIFNSESQSYTRFDTIQSIKNKVDDSRYDSRYKGPNGLPLFYNYTKDEASMNEDMIMEENDKQNVKLNRTKNGLVHLSPGRLKNKIKKGLKENQHQQNLESQKKKLNAKNATENIVMRSNLNQNVKNATENIVMRSNSNQNDEHVHNRNENKNNTTPFKTINGTLNKEVIKDAINFRSEYKVQNISKTINSITTIVATTETRTTNTGRKPIYNSTNITLTDLNTKMNDRVTHINSLSNFTETSVKNNT